MEILCNHEKSYSTLKYKFYLKSINAIQNSKMYYQHLILLLLGVVRYQEISVLATSTTLNDNEGSLSAVVSRVAKRDAESCITRDNKAGECVPYYLCNANDNTISNDGVNLIDMRSSGSSGSRPQMSGRSKRNSLPESSSSPDSSCDSYLDTCCSIGETVDASEISTANVQSTSEGQKVNTPETVKPNLSEPKSTECGKHNPKGVGSVTQDQSLTQAQFGEFPWTVAIMRFETSDDNPDSPKINVYYGGGSLIHPSMVLATAYLVANSNTLKVRAGEWDTQSTKEIYPHQDRDVASVVVHEDFNLGNLHNDIAVLFLAQPVDMAPNVGVVCLPPPRMETPPGTRCFATGWGKDQYGHKGLYTNIMKKIEVPVVDDSTCVKRLQGTLLGRVFQLHSSFMCAGGELNQDTCKGDGGSPLVCPIQTEPGHYMETGIVSWGIECGKDGIPGVYTDVAKFRNWIDDKVREKGYDTSVYTI
ncbi:hypothetical protein K1T71_014578 [Dendrolimus kikuchii]|uniref:Uncharacterized protein n=1 Tax=Dendrolimus kikuchii TaxID=765133 RepID=A0ACC1CEU4_9NEOP|nr:hypothetical protein K1T71_014578 [Dendrolimus kikuchii]